VLLFRVGLDFKFVEGLIHFIVLTII